MKIKSDVKFPPQGWVFFEPALNWWAPLPLAHDRNQTAQDIVNVRRANLHKNLSADLAAALADLETYTFYRLKGDPYYCIDDGTVEKKTSPAKSAAPISASLPVLKRIAQLAVGVETIREWLGDGLTPVPFPKAQGRADVCEDCPKNVNGDWLNKLTGAVAEAIHKHLAAKQRLNLSVANETALGTCEACECRLTLKVWTPLEHIQMSEETMARLHRADDKHNRDCWILSEKKALGDPAVS